MNDISNKKAKYVLCRPGGGLNDMFSQIQTCIEYSKRFKRILILDTKNTPSFKDNWENYFVLSNTAPNIVFFHESMKKTLEGLSTYPKHIEGKINSYQAIMSKVHGNYVDKTSHKPLSFNLKNDYNEDILVHDQCGSSLKSYIGLQHFKLKPEISLMIKNFLKLNDKYVSVHIRNTDLKSSKDFRKTLRKLAAKEPLSKIFLATDSYECQNFAKNLFKDRLLVFFEIPDFGNKPFHYSLSKDLPIYKRNIFSIIDLVLLAKGTNLYNCSTIIRDLISYKIDNKFIQILMNRTVKSGYSRLAHFLHVHQNILNNFID